MSAYRFLARISSLALVAGACSCAERAKRVEPPRRAATTARVEPHAAEPEPPAVGTPEVSLLDADIDWQATPTLRLLEKMASTMTHTAYRHSRSVDVARGIYIFDCSLMAQWVLERSSPVAAESIARSTAGRPLAADYQRHFARITPGSERGGWRRVERLTDTQPGDVIAWLKPKIIASQNTGHVAFIVLPPTRVTGYSDAYLVRVADATRLAHVDDTRTEAGGFGFGTMLFVIDPETGAPRAYGWVGLEWRGFETPIAIARPTR